MCNEVGHDVEALETLTALQANYDEDKQPREGEDKRKKEKAPGSDASGATVDSSNMKSRAFFDAVDALEDMSILPSSKLTAAKETILRWQMEEKDAKILGTV